MLTKRNIFRILSFILLITSILYVVAKNMPSPFGSFRFLYAPLWLLVVTFLKPEVYKQKPVQVLLLYGLISIVILQHTLWRHMNDWYQKSILEEFYALIVVVTLMSYFIIRKDYKGWAMLSKWALIFIVITGVMTIIATSIMPTIARQSAAGYEGLPGMYALYNKTGCGGYGFGQALCMLFPILIYNIKFKSQTVFSRKALIILVVFLFFVVIRMQVFANIITASVAITVSLLGVKRIKTSIAIIVLVIIFVFAIPVQFYADILTSASQFFNKESENYNKLNDMAYFIVNPALDLSSGAGGRAERYPMLFEAFFKSPLFGDSFYNSLFDYQVAAGGHLHWMSRLAVWGIFGFAFYLFMLKTIFKRILSLFDKQFAYYYALCIVAFIIMGLLKTVTGRENVIMLFVIIPGLYYLPLISKMPKKKNHIEQVSNKD